MPSALCGHPRSTARWGQPCVERLEDRLVPSHTPLSPEFQVDGNSQQGFFNAPEMAIASDQQGNFVVVWNDFTELGIDIRARLFDRDGNARGGVIDVADDLFFVRFAPEFAGSSSLDVAMTATGEFVVVYDSGVGVTVDNEERFDPERARVTVAYFGVNGDALQTRTIGAEVEGDLFRALAPSVSRDDQGRVFVSFVSQGNTQDEGAVRVKVFSAGGNSLTGALTVSRPSDTPAGVPSPPSSLPAIAADGAGSFVVAWNADTSPEGEELNVVFRRYASNFNPASDVALVAPSTFLTTPHVGKATDSGAFVITWNTDLNILAQRYNAAGVAQGETFLVNEVPADSSRQPHVAMGAAGDFAISWARGGTSTILARAFNADGSPETEVTPVNENASEFGPNDVATTRDFNQFVVGWSAFPDFENQMESGDQIFARLYRRAAAPPPPDEPDLPDIPDIVFDDPRILIGLLREVDVDPPAAAPLPFIPLTVASPFIPIVLSLPPAALPIAPGIRFFEISSPGQPPALGEISGQVFHDLNGNGERDEGEHGFAGQRVFLDLNNNGLLDRDEPECESDSRGNYVFSGLALARYRVRQDLVRRRIAQTIPQGNEAYVIELSRDDATVTNQSFGTKILATTASEPPGTTEESHSSNSQSTPEQPPE